MSKKRTFILVNVIFLLFGLSQIPCLATEYNPTNTNQYAEYTITITYLALRTVGNSGGSDTSKSLDAVVLIDEACSVNTCDQDYADEAICGYFKQNISISPGQYQDYHMIVRGDWYFQGYVDVDGVIHSTVAGTDTEDYDSETNPENCGRLYINADESEFDDVINNDNSFTIEEDKSYEIKILWKVTGTESGSAVGLVWDTEENGGAFKGGMLSQTISITEK